METPQQTAGRLLSALEILTRAENHLLDTGCAADALALQERTRPLVEKFSELLASRAALPDASAQTRATALLKSREATLERLSVQMNQLRGELKQLTDAQARARCLRPLYRSPAAVSFAGAA